ncbi:MAG: hypothetical protein WD042_15700 [Phycisphaeraceae bacterium]
MDSLLLNLTGERLAVAMLAAMLLGTLLVFYYQRALNQLFIIGGVATFVVGAGLVLRYRGEEGSISGAILCLTGVILLIAAVAIGIVKGMAGGK